MRRAALLLALVALLPLAVAAQPQPATNLEGVIDIEGHRLIRLQGEAIIRNLTVKIRVGSSLTLVAQDLPSITIDGLTVSLGYVSRFTLVIELPGNATLRNITVEAPEDAEVSIWIVAPHRLVMENISVPGPLVVLQPGQAELRGVNASRLTIYGGTIVEAARIRAGSLALAAVQGSDGPVRLMGLEAGEIRALLTSMVAREVNASVLVLRQGGAVLYGPRIGAAIVSNSSHLVALPSPGSASEPELLALHAKNTRLILAQGARIKTLLLAYDGPGAWKTVICCSTIEKPVYINASRGARASIAITGSLMSDGITVTSGPDADADVRLLLGLNTIILRGSELPGLVHSSCARKPNVTAVLLGNSIEAGNLTVFNGKISGLVVGNYIRASGTLIPGYACNGLPLFTASFFFNSIEAASVEISPWLLDSPTLGSGTVLYKKTGRVSQGATNYLSWIAENAVDTDGDGILDYMYHGAVPNYIGDKGLLAEPVGSYELLTPVLDTLASEAGQEPFLLVTTVGARANTTSTPDWVITLTLTTGDDQYRNGSLHLFYAETGQAIAEGRLYLAMENALGTRVYTLDASLLLDREPPTLSATAPRLLRIDPSIIPTVSRLNVSVEAVASTCGEATAAAVAVTGTGLLRDALVKTVPRGECGAIASLGEAVRLLGPDTTAVGVAVAVRDEYGNPASGASLIWPSPVAGEPPPPPRPPAESGRGEERPQAPGNATSPVPPEAWEQNTSAPPARQDGQGTPLWLVAAPIAGLLAVIAARRGWTRRWTGR